MFKKIVIVALLLSNNLAYAAGEDSANNSVPQPKQNKSFLDRVKNVLASCCGSKSNKAAVQDNVEDNSNNSRASSSGNAGSNSSDVPVQNLDTNANTGDAPNNAIVKRDDQGSGACVTETNLSAGNTHEDSNKDSKGKSKEESVLQGQRICGTEIERIDFNTPPEDKSGVCTPKSTTEYKETSSLVVAAAAVVVNTIDNVDDENQASGSGSKITGANTENISQESKPESVKQLESYVACDKLPAQVFLIEQKVSKSTSPKEVTVNLVGLPTIPEASREGSENGDETLVKSVDLGWNMPELSRSVITEENREDVRGEQTNVLTVEEVMPRPASNNSDLNSLPDKSNTSVGSERDLPEVTQSRSDYSPKSVQDINELVAKSQENKEAKNSPVQRLTAENNEDGDKNNSETQKLVKDSMDKTSSATLSPEVNSHVKKARLDCNPESVQDRVEFNRLLKATKEL